MEKSLISLVAEGYRAVFEAEYEAYHGTGKSFDHFAYEFTGRGNDALGPGFYFADSPDVAAHYTTEEGGNIRPVILTINKPIVLDADNEAKQRPLSRSLIEKIIRKSPDLKDKLTNFGDVDYYGLHRVLKDAVEANTDTDLWNQISCIYNDFFDELKPFADAVRKATGYDGIIKEVSPGKVHYVAWFPDQIRSRYA